MQTRDNAARGAAKNRVRADREDTVDVYPRLFASRRHSRRHGRADMQICRCRHLGPRRRLMSINRAGKGLSQQQHWLASVRERELSLPSLPAYLLRIVLPTTSLGQSS